MRLAVFVAASAAYALVASLVWLQLLLQCGLGPDSPVSCNARADGESSVFAVAALVAYALFCCLFRRGRRSGVR